MIDLINNNGDMHSFVAKAIYPELSHLSDDEFKTKHKNKRQIAKAAGFAVQYGGNGYTIANNLSIALSEGDEVYNKYFIAFPELDRYFREVTKKTFDNGYILVDNYIGRKIFITNIDEVYQLRKQMNQDFWNKYKKYKEKGEVPQEIMALIRRKASLESVIKRMSLNYPIQGTGALMIKLAAIFVYEEITKQNKMFKVFINNIIYDELLVECPKEEKEFWSDFVCKSMEKAAFYFCKNPIIKADPQILYQWQK
jgi:DNA polymerase I-like protein with 3'-5' exonuclease and polymerase domains